MGDRIPIPQSPEAVNKALLEKILSLYNKREIEVVEFSSESAVEEGENHLSLVLAVQLKCKHDKSKIHKFIAKLPPTNPMLRGFAMKSQLHKKEIAFYKEVYPKMEKLLKKHGNPYSLTIPKLVYADHDETGYVIVFEDARQHNYKMLDKSDSLTIDQILLIIQELAKFHALSHALSEDIATEFPEFKYNSLDAQILHQPGMLEDRIDDFLGVLKKAGLPQEAIQPMERFKSAAKDRYLEAIRDNPPTMGLVHGDAWRNNVLYGDREDIMLLDFQMVKRGNFLLDLCYLLVTSTDLKFRTAQRERILQHYYAHLCQYTGALKCPLDTGSYPRSRLVEDYEKLKYYSVITGVICLPFMLLKNKSQSAEKMAANMTRCVEVLEELKMASGDMNLQTSLKSMKITE